MTNAASRSTLRPILLLPRSDSPIDQAINPGKLGCQGTLHALRASIAFGHLADVSRREVQGAGNAAVDSSAELISVDGGVHHIIRKGENYPRHKFTLKDRNYDSHHRMSIKMMQDTGENSAEAIGQRVRSLRKSLGLKQPQFSKLVSTQLFPVSQSLVSRWESGERIPPAPALSRMAKLAPDQEQQWWRDRAAMVAGIDQPSESNVTSQSKQRISSASGLIIPVINPKRLGDLGPVSAANVELEMRLPSSWFPMGGEIRAVRLRESPISPVVAGEYLAILDVSRRDPDRLVDCVVATRTPDGIAARWLRKDADVYFLQSVNDLSAPPRVLRHDGEDSIVGQILKWIGDAPSSLRARDLPKHAEIARRLRKRA